MPDQKHSPVLSHYVSVFQVSNIQHSILFYTMRLGFEVTFEWGDPVHYIAIQRDQVKIHLSESKKLQKKSNMSRTIYVFTSAIHQLHADFKAKGINNISALNEADYGMLDFDISDPDGNILTFGCGLPNKS